VTSGNVDVAATGATLPGDFNAATALPNSLVGKLVLGANQLDDTGFTTINLKSVNDVVLESGSRLAPSLMKLATPTPAGGTDSAGSGLVLVTPDLIGTSAIALTAAATAVIVEGPLNINGPMNPLQSNISGAIEISPGAGIAAAPSGAITMSAPNITIDGSLGAPAGTITATAGATLTLGRGATIRAEGYNKPGTASSLKPLPCQAVKRRSTSRARGLT
jgi:hypothetical protein